MLIIENGIAIIVTIAINVAWGGVLLSDSVFVAFDTSMYNFGEFRLLKADGLPSNDSSM
jgi:hypothetical protein